MDFGSVGQEKKPKEVKKGLIATLNHAFNMEIVKRDFTPYHEEIDAMMLRANDVDIADEQSLKGAITLGGEAKKLNKKITEQRKKIVDEPNQFVKSVNAFCKSFTDKLDKIENILKKKISDHQYKQELERREQERKAQEEAKKLQEKLDQEAKEKNVEPVKIITPILPKQDKVSRSDETGASAHVRMKWVGEIIYPNQVPIDYCIPDQRKIDAAIKMGVREIPGVKIYEKPISVLRA